MTRFIFLVKAQRQTQIQINFHVKTKFNQFTWFFLSNTNLIWKVIKSGICWPDLCFLSKRKGKHTFKYIYSHLYVKKINHSICLIFVAKTEIQITQVKIKVSLITFFQRTIWQAKIKDFSITFFRGRFDWQKSKFLW